MADEASGSAVQTSSGIADPYYLSNIQRAQDLATLITGQTGGVPNMPLYTPDFQIAAQDPFTLRAQELAAQGVGSYQPYLTNAGTAMTNANAQIKALIDREQFNPNAYVDPDNPQSGTVIDQYMNPYTENIRSAMSDAQSRQRAANQGQQVGQGAFGGSRGFIQDALSDSEFERNVGQLQAEQFNNAMSQAQGAFDARTQALGQGIGSYQTQASQQANLGATGQGLAQQDISNLSQAGITNQAQNQGILDAARQNQQADVDMPFKLIDFLNTMRMPTGSMQLTTSPGGGNSSALTNAGSFYATASGLGNIQSTQ